MNTGPSITAESTLLEAYQEWRRLAEQEGEAIRAGNWTLVTECQLRLAGLQPRIIRFTNQAREEWQRAGIDLAEKHNHLRQIISSLVELELQNSSLVTAARKIAGEQVDQLDMARQNLKRVHRSYSPQRPAVWNSFS